MVVNLISISCDLASLLVNLVSEDIITLNTVLFMMLPAIYSLKHGFSHFSDMYLSWNFQKKVIFMRMHFNVKMTARKRFWSWANNIPYFPLTIQLNSWFLTLSQYCKIHQEFNYNCFRHVVLSKKKVLIFFY